MKTAIIGTVNPVVVSVQIAEQRRVALKRLPSLMTTRA